MNKQDTIKKFASKNSHGRYDFFYSSPKFNRKNRNKSRVVAKEEALRIILYFEPLMLFFPYKRPLKWSSPIPPQTKILATALQFFGDRPISLGQCGYTFRCTCLVDRDFMLALGTITLILLTVVGMFVIFSLCRPRPEPRPMLMKNYVPHVQIQQPLIRN